ncbi:AraC family transcriptional regulator [Pantoea sp. Acro-805]|jgi:AraC-like DNA-binding protein/quercetin dioxygenase-like cupin family protein|uniref:Arabinose operon regulatory protein n=1 Tax=Candidatus Pantoea formicae TaxID=2608355 RepID=A0ABX0QNB0_9GAMM|nr:helix-turn-helix transcriptional regulator [Pantoea formicae]NIE98562.1 AraC family transcriptional regulator [Pantoea formicae]
MTTSFSEQPSMPVTAVAADYPNGHVIPAHRHDLAQLLYAIEGVLVIETAEGRWVVPPSRGVWLMAGIDHTVRMRGAARIRSILVQPDVLPGLPDKDCVIEVSPLLRELLLAATQVKGHYQPDSRDARLMRFILDELAALPVLPFNLPWPADARIARVCQMLVNEPAETKKAEDWAALLAMSVKTFHRQFLKETGVTFGRWRQQSRLLLSLECLALGQSVLEVALQHGYDSQSAFAAAFKKQFGISPSGFYR